MSKLPELRITDSDQQKAENAPDFGQVKDVILRRIAAYVIDFFTVAVLWSILWLAGSVANFIVLGFLTPLIVLLGAVFPLIYHSFFLSQKGATPGMRFMGIKMAQVENSQPPELAQAIIQSSFL